MYVLKGDVIVSAPPNAYATSRNWLLKELFTWKNIGYFDDVFNSLLAFFDEFDNENSMYVIYVICMIIHGTVWTRIYVSYISVVLKIYLPPYKVK